MLRAITKEVGKLKRAEIAAKILISSVPPLICSEDIKEIFSSKLRNCTQEVSGARQVLLNYSTYICCIISIIQYLNISVQNF